MALISERAHQARLNQKGVVITTSYFDHGGVKKRSSDHAYNDDLHEGVILDKVYTKGEVVYKEPDFNPGVLFTYIKPTSKDGQYVCPNCGHGGPLEEFEYGCEYCGSYLNMDYNELNSGSRTHADIKRRKAKLFIFLPLFVLAGALIGLGISSMVARTWTVFDQLKGLIFGGLLGSLPFFVFYFSKVQKLQSDSMAQREKREAKLNAFFENLKEHGLSPAVYYNNVNKLLSGYLYTGDAEPDVVDYDILRNDDYVLNEQKDTYWIRHDLTLRITKWEKDRFKAREVQAVLELEPSGGVTRDEKYQTTKGINLIQCPNCGQSLDLTKHKCEYCGTEIGYVDPLKLKKITLI